MRPSCLWRPDGVDGRGPRRAHRGGVDGGGDGSDRGRVGDAPRLVGDTGVVGPRVVGFVLGAQEIKFARNLLDKDYTQGVISTDFGGVFSIAAPREYGVVVSWKF